MANYLALYIVKHQEMLGWGTSCPRDEYVHHVFSANTQEEATRLSTEHEETIKIKYQSPEITLERIIEIAREVEVTTTQPKTS